MTTERAVKITSNMAWNDSTAQELPHAYPDPPRRGAPIGCFSYHSEPLGKQLAPLASPKGEARQASDVPRVLHVQVRRRRPRSKVVQLTA